MKAKPKAPMLSALTTVLSEMSSVLATASTIAGILIFVMPVIGLAPFHQSVPLALDFWMAAGLMKLSGQPEWPVILAVGVIVFIRKAVSISIRRTYVRALGKTRT